MVGWDLNRDPDHPALHFALKGQLDESDHPDHCASRDAGDWLESTGNRGMHDDILEYNRAAWNEQVRRKNRWTIPVTSEQMEAARNGQWSLVLTPQKPIPRDWFPELSNCKVLCLASGGGQQGPILAAAGAEVTVYDYSEEQLAQDRMVAERDNVVLQTVQGDMADLSVFEAQTFDLILHPCSNTFVPDVLPVWREAYRVLKTGGTMISGFCNPVLFLFDYEKSKQGELVVRHKIPYADAVHLSDEERQSLIDDGEPFCFGHTLADLLGGQCEAGFSLTGFYEDGWEASKEPIDKYIDCFIATRARKD